MAPKKSRHDKENARNANGNNSRSANANSNQSGGGIGGLLCGLCANKSRSSDMLANIDWMSLGMQLFEMAKPYIVEFIGAQPKPDHVNIDQAFQDAQGTTSFTPYSAPTHSGGNVRALMVGINYPGTSAQLSGCVNDVKQMLATFQKTQFPIKECNILVDEANFPGNSDMPTRANMIKYLAWLVSGSKSGDILFLHYSGHGTHTKASKDSEEENDQLLVPLDYQKAGCILDDDIFAIIAKDLPKGVRMTVLFDCCHSGSMLDLPYTYIAGSNAAAQNGHMKQIRQTNFCQADIVMISGCSDDQTSADVGNTATMGTGSTGAGGAATQCLTYTLLNTKDLSYESVLLETRNVLKTKKFTQVPQLSASKPIDLKQKFSLTEPFKVDPSMARTLPASILAP